MELHLERRLRLNTDTKNKSLYEWAINEIDNKDDIIGADYIPWEWGLYFTATSCMLINHLEVYSGSPKFPDALQRQEILIELLPEDEQDDNASFVQTTFSMLGTDREINSFQLYIHPLDDPEEAEKCTAWGSVSYTHDSDIMYDTTDDCIVFRLFVRPETFSRYVEMISLGSVDGINFKISSAQGFYARWSPSVFARNVKILTKGKEHNIVASPEVQIGPPRLGEIGGFFLQLQRRLEFNERERYSNDINDRNEAGKGELSHLLESMKINPWIVVALLAALYVKLLFD